MPKRLTRMELAAIAFMAYSMYFGAGNLIFPLRIGYAVGSEMMPSLIGFLISAVGLPVLVLWACARVGGGLEQLTSNLPKSVGLLFCLILYIILGPLVATPRTAVVAYDSFVPLWGGESSMQLAAFSFVFFSIALVIAINPNKLMDIVGKIVTPMLMIVLGLIVGGAFLEPQGAIAEPRPPFASAATMSFFAFGLDEGYQTMNPLGSLVLSVVILTVVRGRGVEDDRLVAHSALKAMFIAAVALSVTYAGLTYLGATAHDIAPNAYKGPDIIMPYSLALFGSIGALFLALVVGLACITTAVGLTSACGMYFSKTFPTWSYRQWVVFFTVLSAIVSNVGLGPLLHLSKPVLFAIYPLAMCLVLLCLIQERLPRPRFVFLTTLAPVLPLAILDGLRIAQINAPDILYSLLSSLPLAEQGLYWLLPAAMGLGFGVLAVMLRLVPLRSIR